MARYINTRTGAIIDSPCTISGGDWTTIENLNKVDLKEDVVSEVELEVKADGISEDELKVEPDIEGLTRKDIMQELDAFGIKYNPRATKKELYELMMAGK